MVLKSPGIAYREVDATVYPATVDSSIVGIIGFADKGPENVATLITTPEQLVKTFGEPNADLPGQGLLAALEILETTNRVYYVRAASSTDVEASAVVPLATCPYFNLASNNFFGVDLLAPALRLVINLKKNSASIYTTTVTLPATSSLQTPFESTFKALQSVMGDGTSKGDFLTVAEGADGQAIILGNIAGPAYTLEVSALQGLTGTTPAAILYYTTGVDNLNPISGAGIIPGVEGTDLEAGSEIVSSVTGYGTQLNTTDINYLFKSLYGGPGYNLGRSLKTGEVTGLSLEVDNTVGPWFNVYVNDKGYVNESFRVSFYGDKTFIPQVIKENAESTPLLSEFIKAEIDGETAYTLIPLKSVADRLTDLIDFPSNNTIRIQKCANAQYINQTLNPRCVKLFPGTYNMLGGAHGVDYDVAEDTTIADILIGQPDDKSGMYAIDDDNLNISMAIIPGIHQARVQNALITLAETSQNFIAAVSPPPAIATAQKAVDWMNGRGTVGDRKASINSSFVAVYWPHVQVFNTFTETDIWFDPAVYGIRAMAFTDSVSEPWFAPAGFNRGRLTKPLDTELVLSQGDRDTLYENNINPMVKFFPEGITIFGQKTAKRLPSATDRINVRRLMIFLRKTLLRTTRAYVFEPNDALTWESVRSTVTEILRDLASRRGIAESKVVCDETVNTPLRVSRRELWCKIILRPVEAAEYIIFEVNLTNNTSSVGA